MLNPNSDKFVGYSDKNNIGTVIFTAYKKLFIKNYPFPMETKKHNFDEQLSRR